MIFEIDHNKVDIKVYNLIGEKLPVEKATMDLVNLISILATAASKHYKATGYDALAEMAERVGNETYRQLAACGCYEKEI